MHLIYPRSITSYDPSGTDTFRLGSKTLLGRKESHTQDWTFTKNPIQSWKGKIPGNWGTNHQNQKKELRRLCIADPGKLIGQVDQAGAEAKIVGYIAQPGRMRKLFECGIKPHTYVAMHLFASEWAETFGAGNIKKARYAKIEDLQSLDFFPALNKLIKFHKRNYFIGKKTCHASNYDMGVGVFITEVLNETEGEINLTRKEAQEFLNMYHAIFPEIRKWHLEVQETLYQNKFELRNLQGFPRTFYERGYNLLKTAYAFVPQSTVGTITNIGLTEMQRDIDEGLWKTAELDILQNGHDSIMFQFKDRGKAANIEVAQGCKKYLEAKLVNNRGERFTMGAEASMGPNWYEQEELD